MHLILPYAFSTSEGCAAALPSLQLPHLHKLLAGMHRQAPDSGDASSLSPPHERAQARALGMPVHDGQIAWAALQASQRPELAAQGKGWAFVSLCHWRINTHHVAMSHLPLPDLTLADSNALMAAMQPYFEEDGMALHPDQPGRWLVQGDVFATLATASPDRVVGGDIKPWMPTSTQAAPLRRLQNEMQMLLYTHPVNDARSARGLPPVNSFWLSGSGALPIGYQPPPASAHATVPDTLRRAALAQDWPAWTRAWHDLDANQLRALLQAQNKGQSVHITLCGERHAQCWQSQAQPVWRRIVSVFGSRSTSQLLEKL